MFHPNSFKTISFNSVSWKNLALAQSFIPGKYLLASIVSIFITDVKRPLSGEIYRNIAYSYTYSEMNVS